MDKETSIYLGLFRIYELSKIEIETSLNRGLVDWFEVCPSVYIFHLLETVFTNNSNFKPGNDLISESHDERGFIIEAEEIFEKAWVFTPFFIWLADVALDVKCPE
jgi:hypothetical protein